MENKSNRLAVISLVINVVLVVCVIILFVKMPAGDPGEHASNGPIDSTIDVSNLNDKGSPAVTVFYNNDSLMLNSKFLLDVQKDIQEAEMNAQAQLQKKQNEMVNWDRKWQEKGMLISTEQEQYQKEGMKLQEEMMQLQQTVEQEFMEKQTTLTLAGLNRIAMFARQIATEEGYDFVLNYQLGGQVVFVNPKMDITNELIERMNADWDATFADPEAAPAE